MTSKCPHCGFPFMLGLVVHELKGLVNDEGTRTCRHCKCSFKYRQEVDRKWFKRKWEYDRIVFWDIEVHITPELKTYIGSFFKKDRDDKKTDELIERKSQIARLTAYKIVWTEFERGWGQRPDGVSYHLSKEAANSYLETHQCHGDSECYSRGDTPVLAEIDETLAKELAENDVVWRRS